MQRNHGVPSAAYGRNQKGSPRNTRKREEPRINANERELDALSIKTLENHQGTKYTKQRLAELFFVFLVVS